MAAMAEEVMAVAEAAGKAAASVAVVKVLTMTMAGMATTGDPSGGLLHHAKREPACMSS